MENVWKKWKFIRAGVPKVIELLTNVKKRYYTAEVLLMLAKFVFMKRYLWLHPLIYSAKKSSVFLFKLLISYSFHSFFWRALCLLSVSGERRRESRWMFLLEKRDERKQQLLNCIIPTPKLKPNLYNDAIIN